MTLSAFSTASAQVYYSYNNGYGYNNTYQYQNTTQASYTYTQGCYTYYYNGQTNTTSIIGSTCQSQNVYSYTTPVSYTYVTAPTTYTYTQPTQNYYQNSYQSSPYYTYGYSNGSWYPRYNNSLIGDFLFGNSSYDTGYVPTPTTYCYTAGGYYVCQ
jgi:hypothetical protein